MAGAPRGQHQQGPHRDTGAGADALPTLLSLSRCLLFQEPGALRLAPFDSLPSSEVGGVARITTSREMCLLRTGSGKNRV